MKRAQWLKYCLDIGYPKSYLDRLGEIWDEHKNEDGSLKPSQPLEEETQEEQSELWKEARRLIDSWRINELFDKFTIQRKKVK
jgi:hypothetical protein